MPWLLVDRIRDLKPATHVIVSQTGCQQPRASRDAHFLVKRLNYRLTAPAARGAASPWAAVGRLKPGQRSAF